MTTWPQWTLLTWYVVGISIQVYESGKKGEGILGVFSVLIVYAAMITILYFGGFWAALGFAP